MKLPVTYKGIVKLLIAIAENSGNYTGNKLTDKEEMEIHSMIADIQNDLGEMRELLEKLKLEYHG